MSLDRELKEQLETSDQLTFSNSCLQNGFFECVFDQITQISGETKRTKVVQDSQNSLSDSEEGDLNVIDEYGSKMEPKLEDETSKKEEKTD